MSKENSLPPNLGKLQFILTALKNRPTDAKTDEYLGYNARNPTIMFSDPELFHLHGWEYTRDMGNIQRTFESGFLPFLNDLLQLQPDEVFLAAKKDPQPNYRRGQVYVEATFRRQHYALLDVGLSVKMCVTIEDFELL